MLPKRKPGNRLKLGPYPLTRQRRWSETAMNESGNSGMIKSRVHICVNNIEHLFMLEKNPYHIGVVYNIYIYVNTNHIDYI